jgi:hypothetical protein
MKSTNWVFVFLGSIMPGAPMSVFLVIANEKRFRHHTILKDAKRIKTEDITKYLLHA